MVPTAIIRHPNDPSRFVRLEQPLRSQTFDLSKRQDSAVTPIAVQKADGTVLYKKVRKPDGSEVETTIPEVFINPAPESITAKVARLALYAKEWSGIKDRDGNRVTLSPETIFWLWEEANDAKLPACLWCKKTQAEHGTPEDGHFYLDEVSFGLVIIHEINTNAELFNPDPTAIGSASPLT